MPALVPTEFTGKITWLGRVSEECEGVRSAPLTEAVHASFAGIEGETHAGLTRSSCVRVKSQYPEGTEIRNVRQLSIVSAEELAVIANEIGLSQVAPEWLGASMVVEGIPGFQPRTPFGPAANRIGHDSGHRYAEPALSLPRQGDRERPSRSWQSI